MDTLAQLPPGAHKNEQRNSATAKCPSSRPDVVFGHSRLGQSTWHSGRASQTALWIKFSDSSCFHYFLKFPAYITLYSTQAFKERKTHYLSRIVFRVTQEFILSSKVCGEYNGITKATVHSHNSGLLSHCGQLQQKDIFSFS